MLCISAAIWLYSCSSCTPAPPPVAGCDTTITNWKHFINKATAQAYITNFENYKDGNKPFLKTMIAQSHLYDSAKTMMRNMMLRDSCTGMRIYYGLTPGNKVIPIVCGVTRAGNDIYWRRPRPTDPTARTMEIFEDGLCDYSQEEPPTPEPSALGEIRIMIRK